MFTFLVLSGKWIKKSTCPKSVFTSPTQIVLCISSCQITTLSYNPDLSTALSKLQQTVPYNRVWPTSSNTTLFPGSWRCLNFAFTRCHFLVRTQTIPQLSAEMGRKQDVSLLSFSHLLLQKIMCLFFFFLPLTDQVGKLLHFLHFRYGILLAVGNLATLIVEPWYEDSSVMVSQLLY